MAGLPDRLKKPFAGSREDLVLEVAGDKADLVRRQGSERVVLTTLFVGEGFDERLPQFDYSRSRLAIEISDRYLLRRRLEWPIQAEGNLGSAIRFQLHKLIPMAADEVYFRHKAVARHRDKGVVELDLLVVPRKSIDPWLERLSDSRLRGLVKSLTVKGLGPQVDFLPEDFSAGKKRFITAPKVVVGVTLVLLVLALLLPLYEKQRELDLLDAEVAKYRQHADETLALRQDAQRKVERATELRALVRKMPSRVALLEELALRLPDSAFATSVTIRGNLVQLEGEATSSTEVIDLLAASPLFRNVVFAAPVSKNPGNGTERFRLSFSVVEAGG